MIFIDTHCHLDFPELDADDWPERLRDAQIGAVVVPGVTAERWPELKKLSTLEGLYAAYGLHPCFCREHRHEDIGRLEKVLGEGSAIAVGEIGLDLYIPEADLSSQLDYLLPQLELAKKYRLPVILHVRKAHTEMVRALKSLQFDQGGVVHAYSGSYEQAVPYFDLGFKLGVGGAYTFPRARRLQALVKRLPSDSFVLETDAPDMRPAFATDQPNTPLHLPRIAEVIAQLRGDTLHDLARQTTQNAVEIFPALKESLIPD
jgi:TatD DNase family protein